MTTITAPDLHYQVSVGQRQNPSLVHLAVNDNEATLSMDEANALIEALRLIVSHRSTPVA